jgi:hypothetical protein
VILILAPEQDVHARRVAQEIALLGRDSRILDGRSAGSGLRASVHFVAGRVERSLLPHPASAALDVATVSAVWARRPGAAAIPACVLDENQRAFAMAEWRDLMAGILQFTTAVNPIAAQRAAAKPIQLAVAQRVGLAVPDTLITSDPVAAEDFIELHRGSVVHKAMNSPRDTLLETRRWNEWNREVLPALPLAPTIFQQLISGPCDIRVTMVGPEHYAAAIESGRSPSWVDSRLDLNVPVTPWSVPASVLSSLRELMAELGLVFATIDLKIDHAGTPYFLELNPQGQFLYMEILAGLPIAAAMARLLTTTSSE